MDFHSAVIVALGFSCGTLFWTFVFWCVSLNKRI